MENKITNSAYQSTFLPIIEKASLELKKLVLFYALHLKSKLELLNKIKGLIKAVDEKLPKDLIDRQKYIDSLYNQSEKLIRNTYEPIIRRYYSAIALLLLIGLKQPKNPLELNTYIINNNKEISKGLVEITKRPNLKYEAKGFPQVFNYPNELKKRINELSKEPIDADSGISLWQKAEIDLRHEKQMDRLQELKDSGVRYAWISSHPDCSKRCAKWQSKLMDLEAPSSELSNFRMRKKLDGYTVYCFNDIINQTQTTKAGRVYKNNVIVGFNCFDKETEVFTNNGWKLFKDLTEEDLIYTLNPKTRLTEWQKPINYYKGYSEKMIHAQSFISDLMVTPNHNMLYYTQFNTELRFKEAKDLKKTHIQYAGQEWIGNNQKFITIGNKQVDTKIFCRFLGYWLGDGSIHCDTALKIAQMNNDKMWDSLQDLPFPLWRDDNKIIVRSKQLVEMFRPLGKCNTKYVFNWVKELSKECLNELLEGFLFTDGYKTKPTLTKSGYLRKPHKLIFTTSKRLCDDLCEIALKCGYRPKIDIKKQKGKEQTFKNGTYNLNYDMYVIHLNTYTSFTYKTIEEVDYNDNVYCVEVPNHTLLVKRNGRIQWCGNCRHKLIPYTKGSVPPTEYTKEEIKLEREVNATLRELEREIRKCKQQAILYKPTDLKLSKQYEMKAKALFRKYESICNKYGFSLNLYRVKV